jgi:hypothetical protein
MKKTAIIAGAVFLLLTATVNAQQPDSSKQQPATAPQTSLPATTTPETTTPPANNTTNQQGTVTNSTTSNSSTTSTSSTAPYGTDKWNNWDSKTKYPMLPMPEALTTEKVFPVIGKYDVTDKEGNHSEVTVTLDESNKGIAWVEGLPQGKTKIYLRKSPAVYKIPVQKTDDGKDIAAGVLIYDKDANTLNVCSNCTYNADDPATVFLPQQAATEEQPVAKTKTKGSKVKVKKEVKPKPVFYTGTKVMQDQQTQTAPAETTTPATTPAPQQ